MSRRLVPMPKRRRPSSGPPAQQPPAPPPAPLKAWHCFAFLIATAVAMYFLKWPILVIAALVGFFYCLAGSAIVSRGRCLSFRRSFAGCLAGGGAKGKARRIPYIWEVGRRTPPVRAAPF